MKLKSGGFSHLLFRRWAPILLFMMLVVFWVGCNSGKGEPGTDGLKETKSITVSILPQKYFLQRIAGDRFDINVMIPPGHSPATYEPTPQQMTGVSRSVLYLRIGHIGFEKGWMDKIASINPTMKIIDTSRGVSLLTGIPHDHGEPQNTAEEHKTVESIEAHTHSPAKANGPEAGTPLANKIAIKSKNVIENDHCHEHGHNDKVVEPSGEVGPPAAEETPAIDKEVHEAEDAHNHRHNEGKQLEKARPADTNDHDHDHGGVDPHIWLSPEAVKIQARHILDALIAFDPTGSEFFRKNYDLFVKDIDSLQEENKAVMAPLKGRQFMVYHPAWTYFAREYGLRQLPIEIEGKSPGVKDLKNIIDLAKKENIRVIFVQSQFDSQSAQAVAGEIGGKVVAMDPLAFQWLDNMKKIALTFKNSLEME
ncbi:MAG: zinc ABC transporter solute-binding protein [bacterium]|nr:zinc ABC transporter solute-binding protein [bacterium]